MKKQFFCLFALTIILTFSSCQKGDPGPKGDTGAAGATGPTGPAGSTGQANIQVYNFVATNLNWVSNGGYWNYLITIPQLTQGVFNNSIVLVYYNQNNQMTLLPFTTLGVDYMYYASVGLVTVQISKVGVYAVNNPSFFQPATLKVVIAQ